MIIYAKASKTRASARAWSSRAASRAPLKRLPFAPVPPPATEPAPDLEGLGFVIRGVRLNNAAVSLR